MSQRKEIAQQLPVEVIDPSPFQPRKNPQKQKQRITELAANISAVGQLQPIIVRRLVSVSSGEGSSGVARYELIAGELRWRAHQQLGLQKIHAFVREVSDTDAACQALAENLNRSNLADYEVAMAVARIENNFPTAKATMESLAIEHNKLYRLRSYNNLPEYVLASLEEAPRLLSKRYAYELAGLLAADSLGAAAQDALRVLWPEVVRGVLLQSHLCDRIVQLATQAGSDAGAVGEENREEQLCYGQTVVGRVTWQPKILRIDLKRALLPQGLEQRIIGLVKEAINCADTIAVDPSGTQEFPGKSSDVAE